MPGACPSGPVYRCTTSEIGNPIRLSRLSVHSEGIQAQHQRSRRLSPGGLTADGRDRDMPHRRVSLGAMPMTFTGLDMRDIADIDLMLFMLRCHHAGARGHDQDLVAGMRMPSRGATLAEVHHAAVIVRGVPRLNDGLT